MCFPNKKWDRKTPFYFFKIKFYLRFLIEVYTPRTPANDAVASVNTSVSIPAFGSFFLSVVVFYWSTNFVV